MAWMFGSARPPLRREALAAASDASRRPFLFGSPDQTKLHSFLWRSLTEAGEGTAQLAWLRAQEAMSVDAMFARGNSDGGRFFQVSRRLLILASFAFQGFSGRLWLRKMPSERRLSFGARTGHGNAGGNILHPPIVTAMDFFQLSIAPEARIFCSSVSRATLTS